METLKILQFTKELDEYTRKLTDSTVLGNFESFEELFPEWRLMSVVGDKLQITEEMSGWWWWDG